MKPWEILESRLLLDKRWLRVREDRVRTGSGHVIDEFHVLECPSWSCVCCVTRDQQLVLVEQYRHGRGAITLEIPAGVIETTETPLAGAQRELREETGYEAEDWVALGTLRPEPARNTHRAFLFVARGAVRCFMQALDPSEDVRVRLHPLAELDALIDEGRVDHAVHVAALLLAARRGLLVG
ncbi:MAG: NUDIX hydrolase [Polyangiaceae bacterium]|nr:NUDIX hydrolase [Polyangiaceae bacterium]